MNRAMKPFFSMARAGVFVLVLSFLVAFAGAMATSNSQCRKPAVRKEWRSLTRSEQKDWIDSVKCLARLPHDPAFKPTVPLAESTIPPVNPKTSAYDDWVYMHMDLNIKVRFTGLFFPWHRWMVAAFEQTLRDKCGFKGTSPYWNYSIDAHDPHNSPLFKNLDPETGLGGWGDPRNDYTVYNGAFSNTSGWNLAYPTQHHLRRNFTIQPFVNSARFLPNKMIHGFVGDYKGLQTYIEGFNGTHQGVHLMLGGDLGGNCPANAQSLIPAECQNQNPTYSPNEPIFWLHHGMIDKVWADWQQANPKNAHIYFGGQAEALNNLTYFTEFPTGAPPNYQLSSKMPADNLYPDPTIESVMSTTGGSLCYIYE
uniref:Di-copper centre-containing protein n=1 Tax=Mycena chlorophos TaxID=658473 RepID=A0ABQ0LKN2_MYCCL|nr:di-copper centre-containing protein [Mycena chlorophos]